MKQIATLGLALSLITPCEAEQSAFATVQFGDVLQVELPQNWNYLDPSIAAHLNTSSEAAAKQIGLSIKQGDNVVLVAANANDSQGKTKASFRISVRLAPSASQAEMRELMKKPSFEISSMLKATADETASAMLKAPGVKSYSIRAEKLDSNGSLTCLMFKSEGDLGQGPMATDLWICPAGDRTIKLTTSYSEAYESIYRPTLENIWQSLKVSTQTAIANSSPAFIQYHNPNDGFEVLLPSTPEIIHTAKFPLIGTT